jgi:PAS domain S-box-containing protein
MAENSADSEPGVESTASVLVVDDEAGNRLAVRAMLEETGVAIVEARSCDEALQQAAARDFAVILLDVLMPDVNGFEAARRLRSSPRSSRTPIIFITGLELDRHWIEEAYGLGAVDYLVKPILPLVLTAKVRGFAELFQIQQRAQREAELLRLLIDSTQDQAICMLDAAGAVTSWNQGAERLTGHRASDVIGQPYSRLYPDDGAEPCDPAEQLRLARADGHFEREGWLVRPHGSRFWALSVITPLYKPDGSLLGFSKIIRDLTHRRHAEENARRLREAESARSAAEEQARLLQQQAAMLEAALDCIISIDHEGRVVEFNPAAEATFGYARGEVVGRELAELVIPEGLRERQRRSLARAVETGEGSILGRRLEMTALRADGSEFPIEIAVMRLPGEGPPIFTAYARDISERRRIEQQRSARTAVSQILAQSATVADAAGRVLQTVCEYLGWDTGLFWVVDPQRQVLKCIDCWRPADARFDEFEAVSRGMTFERGIGLPGRLWASREPAWILDVVRDANFPRAEAAGRAGLRAAFGCPIVIGGETVGTIEFFSGSASEPDANLLEMISTVAGQFGQFAERKRTETALHDSEQRFSRFMQQFPGLAWIKDLEGRYLFVNDAAEKAFRMPRSQLYGRTDPEVFPAETAGAFMHNDRQALAHESGVQVIETLADEQGDLRHSIVSKFPIVGPDGRPQFVGGMAIDITDRLRAENALRDSDRRKDEFLAMLAHELRNPLAPIRNALQILQLPDADPAKIRSVTDVMDRQVQHLVRLVDDLLDVSRVMRGRIELRREQVPLATIVARAVETVQPLIDARRHTLHVEAPDDALVVNVDPVRMVQAIANLLTNAAKYTEDDGSIWLSAVRDGAAAVVCVRDNGIGIAPEMLPHVFELFVQADQSSSRAQGGLGIGLTLVRNLVELHGATVEARSRGLGSGSEFVIRLPLTKGPRCESSSAPAAVPSRPIRRRLLIVDDNQDAAKMLATLLRLKGQEVRVAHDGAAALEMLSGERPDLVFLDLGMPGLDGYEVARRIRSRPDLAGVKLAALTGWGQDEDRRRTSEAGFDCHLTKPLDVRTIDALLAELP